MSGWREINLSRLFPAPLADAGEQVGEVCEQIAGASETIADAIEVLSSMLVDASDPLRTIIQELIALLENTMSDVLHTGVYFFHDCAGWPLFQVRSRGWDEMRQALQGEESPQHSSTAIAYGWSGWLARWSESLRDVGDKQRPVFSGDADVGAVFLAAGSPTVDGFLALLRALGELLGIQAFKDAWNRFVVTVLDADARKGDRAVVVRDTAGFAPDDWILIGPASAASPAFTYIKELDDTARTFVLLDPLPQDFSRGTPVAMVGSASSVTSRQPIAPDWSSTTLAETFPFLSEADALVQKIVGMLSVADGFGSLLQELAQALGQRADKLRRVARMIEELIERITSLLGLSGLYALQVRSSTGLAGLCAAIEEAGNPPLPPESFVFGACLLTGGADFEPLAEFLGA